MSETMSPESLRALARYRPIFEIEGFRFAAMKSEPGQMPWFEFSEEAERFLKDAYEHHWVIAGFDWSDWAKTADARLLRDDPSAMETASPEDLGKLLTTVIRSDRFCEDALASAFDDGLLTRVAARAAALVGDH